MQPTIAIIGAGHMGACLLGGLIANHFPAEKIWVSEPSEEKLQSLRKKFHIHTSTNNMDVVQSADVIILAVKPAIIKEVITEIKKIIHKNRPLVISVAAGIRESSLQNGLGGDIPIVRVMPNTPALVGAGAFVLFANSFVSKEQCHLAESLFRPVGMTIWIEDEKLMDAVTALSGCGPAYFFLTMEALQQAGEKLGLPKELARLLTIQTAFGAAKMALESEHTPAELRQQVASPGGSTERALQILENVNIREIYENALRAAKNRAEEMADVYKI